VDLDETTRKRKEIESHINKFLQGGGKITVAKSSDNRTYKDKGSAKWLLKSVKN
jgi:hypothetical protein